MIKNLLRWIRELFNKNKILMITDTVSINSTKNNKFKELIKVDEKDLDKTKRYKKVETDVIEDCGLGIKDPFKEKLKLEEQIEKIKKIMNKQDEEE